MSAAEAELAARVRAHLQTLAPCDVPLTYRDLAAALGLRPPQTIHRLTLALEATMAEDVAAGRPLIAALVVSRTATVPQTGFFELAARLGRLPAEPAAAAREAYAREFEAAIATWLKPRSG